jgi:dTDP-4-dehydrorhamnose 3,5-epimerase-like enzyme
MQKIPEVTSFTVTMRLALIMDLIVIDPVLVDHRGHLVEMVVPEEMDAKDLLVDHLDHKVSKAREVIKVLQVL